MTGNVAQNEVKVMQGEGKMTGNDMEKKEKALKAAMALNLCTTSISKIISSQDINIMRHEYDYILNNINLENIIKDEALLSTMKSILDTLSFYLIQYRDREMIARRYQHKMNNAIWDSVMGIPSTILLAVSSPISAIVSAAVSGAISIGSAYVNYRRSKSNAELERMEEEWKLERAALEQLHALRLSLFETAWRLFATYEICDEHRLSVKQVDLYNGLLMEPNPQWRYQKLDMIKDYFEAYPYFWYELSEAAYQVYNSYVQKQQDFYQKNKNAEEYLQKALVAIDKFFEIIKNKELLRQDVIYASAIVRKIQILHEKGKNWNVSVIEMAKSLDKGKCAEEPDKDKCIKCIKCINELEKFYRKLAADSPELLMNAAMIFLAAYVDDNNSNEYADAARRLFWMLVNQGYNVPMTTRMLSWLDLYTKDNKDYELLKALVGGPREQTDGIEIIRENDNNLVTRTAEAEKNTMIITPDTFDKFMKIEERWEDTIAELKQISGTMFDIALKKACPIFNEQSTAIAALSNYFRNKNIVTSGKTQEEVETYLQPIYAELNAQCLVWQDTWDIDFSTMHDAVKKFHDRVENTKDKVGYTVGSPYMQAESVCKMIALFRSYFISRMVFKTLLFERRSSKGSKQEQEDLLRLNIKYFNGRIYDLRSKISQFQDNYFISNITVPTTLMDYSIDYFADKQKITATAWKYDTPEKEKALKEMINKGNNITVEGISFRKNGENEQLTELLNAMKEQNLVVLVYNLGAPIPPEAIPEKAYPKSTSIIYCLEYLFKPNTRAFRRKYDNADYRIALYPSKIAAYFNPAMKIPKDRKEGESRRK